MRRVVTTLALGAAMVLSSGSAANATHKGCEHNGTTTAHSKVPHHDTHGTRTAHSKIPYCPPETAPGHR